MHHLKSESPHELLLTFQIQLFVLANVLAELSISFMHIEVTYYTPTTMVPDASQGKWDTVSTPELHSLTRESK